MSFQMTHKSDNGDILKFLANDPILLSYKDLLDISIDKKYNLKFKIKAGEATFNESAIEENTIVTMPTKTGKGQSVFALTIKGWLPLPFIGESMILADRNVIDGMEKILNIEKQDSFQERKWWMDMLLHLDTIVNPILYAYEGKDKGFHSFEDFCKDFDKGAGIIAKYNLKSIVYTSEDYLASYTILKNLKIEIDKEIEFLISVSPLVCHTLNNKKKQEIQLKIDTKREELGLSSSSLAYLLVLSCLYENNTKKKSLHARKVLKPKENYTKKMAYNTVMDLLHLKMLVLTRKLPFMKRIFFCTADLHLAAFWVGLNVHNIVETDGVMTFSCDIENILPSLQN